MYLWSLYGYFTTMSQRLDAPKVKQKLRALFVKDRYRWNNEDYLNEQEIKLYDALHTPATTRKKRKMPEYY